MTTDTSATQNHPLKHTHILLLVLIAAGLAGNYFKYPVFLNIDFLFGSIFAMLALQFFGAGRGIFSAAIIAAYTWIIWNHPYAIIIMTAEAAVVAWLTSRRRLELVLATTLYWVFIGIPLVFLFYHLVMLVPISSTMIVLTKQAINGITNALIAKLIFIGFVLWQKRAKISLREIVSNLLAFFVLCPALLMLALDSRSDFAEIDQSIKTTLLRDNKQMTESLENWLRDRKNSIITLAGIAATLDTSRIQSRLEQTHSADLHFLRIGLQDKNSISTAFSPLWDELGKSNLGRSFADRPFIPILKKTLRPMLSEVVMGKVGIPQPQVLMLVPVVSSGEYAGYVAGTLNFNYIQNLLEAYASGQHLLFTLLDKNGNIISTNRNDQKNMTPFDRGKGTSYLLDDGLSQWIPVLPDNISIMERWKKSSYFIGSPIGSPPEWKLVIEQPVAPFQKILYDRYSNRLLLLFVLLLVVMVLADFAGRKIVMATDELRRLTRDMPTRLPSNSSIPWPDSGIKETSHLIVNFREMANALTAVFEETRHINMGLERQVLERTKELLQAKEAADAANLAKSRFLSVVAHEFHTPLGLLTISVDILDRYWERLDKKHRLEQHEQIRSAARQMSRLVDSVVAFNSQETSGFPIVPVMVDVARVCRSIAEEVKTVWGDGQSFFLAIAPDCGTIMLDEALFRWILENLLSNAFRFTPPCGEVSLSVSRRSKQLLIKVSDTGIGIPEEDVQKIFEAFYRGGNIEARRGLGLGLSIVSEAVQQLNGVITVESSVGNGSTFLLELPVFNTPPQQEMQ